MKYRFAHLTDCHLGAWRNPLLREINLKAFQRAIEISIQKKVDFILITGDFFDVNIPDLSIVKKAVDILQNAKQSGIEIYMIYGSHDFNASSTSIIDILHSTGLFVKPIKIEQNTREHYFENNTSKIKNKNKNSGKNELNLELFVEKKTNLFKITGLSGRKNNLDVHYYHLIDLKKIESETGPKIFLFHAPITEFTTSDMLYGEESIPLSLLPKNFIYYGGGHVHKRIEHKNPYNGNPVIFPGPLFGNTFTDLENTALGEKRGFYIIEYDNNKYNNKKSNYKIRPIFQEIRLAEIIFKQIEIQENTPSEIENKINQKIENLDVKEKIILIKISGKLSSGKRSDINFSKFEEKLINKGALLSFINRSNLIFPTTTQLKINCSNIEEIENKILYEKIKTFRTDNMVTNKELQEYLENKLTLKTTIHEIEMDKDSRNNKKINQSSGLQTGKILLKNLKTDKFETETKIDYENRILKCVKVIMD
ncbi:MAG: DNA repair exonuclease [Nitrososphaeraceae archaeon]